MKSCKKVIALIIAVIICCSCFFCAEKAEAFSPPAWYELTFHSCAYVEIIGVGSETLTFFEHDYTQIKVNVLQTYLEGFSGDLFVPSECVDFVLSNNYALIFADDTDEGLICYDYDYDANSTRIISLFPVEDNKIIIPTNYYEFVTFTDGTIGMEPYGHVLFMLVSFNESLSEDEEYLAFSDGMDIELLDDYFNLVHEAEKRRSEFFLYLLIVGVLYLFTAGSGTPISFVAIIIVVVLIIFYYAEKKKKSKQVDTPNETGENSKE
ncbi:MAG: hypothetical protein PHI78_05135 [Clostridia bacterium]|nr:hypothetical protein [Clostridia bacterium]